MSNLAESLRSRVDHFNKLKEQRDTETFEKQSNEIMKLAEAAASKGKSSIPYVGLIEKTQAWIRQQGLSCVCTSKDEYSSESCKYTISW
jgi:hypothetical protein